MRVAEALTLVPAREMNHTALKNARAYPPLPTDQSDTQSITSCVGCVINLFCGEVLDSP